MGSCLTSMPAIVDPLASKPLSTERSSQAPTDPAATTAPTDRSSLPRTTSKTKQYLVKGTKFEVDSRYEVKKGIGQGAYGLVCRAQDTQSGDRRRSRTSRTPSTASACSVRSGCSS